MTVTSETNCSNCQNPLRPGAAFCGKCGAGTGATRPPASGGPGAPPSSSVPPPGAAPAAPAPSRDVFSPRLILAGAGAVVTLLLLVGLWSFVGGGGGSSPLVIEPGRDGFGDLHLIDPSVEPNRDSRVLEDVDLTGSFVDITENGRITSFGQYGLEYDGGVLLAYRQEDEDDSVVAVAKDGEVTEIVDGDGFPTTFRADNGTFVVFFGSDRCQVYELNGTDAERVKRADSCFFTAGSYLYALDKGSSRSEVSRIDLGTLEETDLIETDSANSSLQVSPDGSVVAVETFDGNDQSFEFVDDDGRGDEVKSDDTFLIGVMNDGVLAGEVNDRFEQDRLFYLDGENEETILEDQAAVTAVSPSGDWVVLLATDSDVVDYQNDDVELYLWRPGTDATSATTFDGVLRADWLSDDRLLIIDGDGVAWLAGRGGDVTEVGELDEPYELIEQFRLDDQTALIRGTSFDSADGSLYLLRGSGPIVEVGPWADVRTVRKVPGRNQAVLQVREDLDDDLTLAILDLGSGELEEIDEEESFRDLAFDGNDLWYGVKVGDSANDLEVRRYRLGGSDDPENVIEEVRVLIPGPIEESGIRGRGNVLGN